MAKETELSHPPNGIVGLCVYNATDDKWYVVRGSDSGALKVTSPDWPLPTGAATAANQATEITALQSLQNLVGALHDVGLDELDVNVIATAGAPGYALDGSIDEVAARIGEPGEAAAGTLIKRVEEQLTALQSIQNLVGALHDVGLDELDVQVAASALPSGAATSAKQLADGHNVTVDNATLAVLSGDDKIFAFESIVEESLTTAPVGAGTNNLNGTAVGSGKVWKVTQAAVRYTGTAPTNVQLRAAGLAGTIMLMDRYTVVSARWYMWQGEIYLQVGDYMQATVFGATAGDTFDFRYAGVQMDAP